MAHATDDPQYEIGDTVILDLPGERTFHDHDKTGEVIDTGIEVDNRELTVVSSGWERNGWEYNLRDDDGFRVWSVPEHELEAA